ncbi:MAG: M56 family metallopeptidase [Candidatus Methanofastidiosia archaeon]
MREEIENLAFALALVLLIYVLNEIVIKLFRISNPSTKFKIYMISLLTCFSLFILVPLKVRELNIILENSESVLFDSIDSIYTIKASSVFFATRYSDFAILSAVSAILTLSFFSIVLLASKRLIKYKIGARELENPKVLKLIDELEREIGVEVSEVVSFEGEPNAFVFSYPPILALSRELLEKLDKGELKLVLRHELYHIRNRDTLLKPLLLSISIFFFYNPLSYFLYKRLMEYREYVADKSAIFSEMEKRKFLSLLLKFHTLEREHGVLSFKGSKNLRNRINSLLSTQKERKAPILISILLTLSLIFSGNYYLGANFEYSESYVRNLKDPQSLKGVERVFLNFSDQEIIEMYEKKIRNREKIEFYLNKTDAELIKILLREKNKSKESVKINLNSLNLNKRRFRALLNIEENLRKEFKLVIDNTGEVLTVYITINDPQEPLKFEIPKNPKYQII